VLGSYDGSVKLSGDGERPFGAPAIISVISPVRGSGRTSALVNLAWLLACAGHRVLAVDAGDGLHRVADYLQHVAVETTLVSTPQDPGTRVSGAWSAHAPATGEAYRAERRFVLPAGLGQVDVVACASHEVEGVLTRVRSLPSYDVVLVDQPTMSSQLAARCGRWSDCLVVCFRPLRDQVIHALALSREVRQGGVGAPRVVLLASQVQPGAETEQRGMTLGLVEGDRRSPDEPPIAVVAIPYRAFEPDGAVAALIDAPGDPQGLLGAHRDLVRAVLPDGPEPRDVPARVRDRYRGALRLRVPEPEQLGVLYLGRERPWADWVAEELRPYGVPVVLLPTGCAPALAAECTQVVVVVGDQRNAIAAEAERLGLLDPARTLSLLVTPSATAVGPGLAVRPVAADPRAASAALTAGLGWIPPRPNVGPPGRLPGSGRLQVVRRPLRNVDFVGRDGELDAMRDLLPTGTYSRVTVWGPAGSGKSEIACEYAYRFADTYDVIWWVQAHTRATVRIGLTELARELKIDSGGDPPSAVHAALKESTRRWLVIFDNAEDLQAVEDLIPVAGSATGTGHVIVSRRLPEGDTVLPLGPFARGHSLALLRKWLPDLRLEAAERIAELTGDLPIAVRLAVAWLKESSETAEAQGLLPRQAVDWAYRTYVDLFEDRLSRQEPPPGGATEEYVTGIALQLTLDILRGIGHAEPVPARQTAVRVAQLISFLSPDGVSLALLSSARMLSELASFPDSAGDWVAQDGLLLHYALRVANRHGLFELNRAGPSEVRMHRMLSKLLRDLMSAEERTRTRDRVLAVLASYAPTDAEGDAIGRPDNMRELAGHVQPSGAPDCDDPAVRRWLVLQVRFAYTEGDVAAWEAMVAFARELRGTWLARFGRNDPLYLRLCVQLANLERALGHIEAACALDQEALVAQQLVLGPSHPRTLLTSRGLAADYRGMGRFHEAWLEDAGTVPGLERSLGRDHLETLRAVWDLALSWHLDGNAVQALQTSDEVLQRLWRLFPPDSPHLARAVVNHAMFLRELGEYGRAQRVLDEVRTRLRDGTSSYALDDLRLRDGYAICWRGLGFPQRAKDEHEQVRAALVVRVGEDHPYTIATTVALSADLHVLGQPPEAIDTVRVAVDRLRARDSEEHPFINVCRSNLALYHRAAGDTRQAVSLGRESFERLLATLLEQHPWTLGAGLNLCGSLIMDGNTHEAARLLGRLDGWSRTYISPSHPVSTKIAGSLRDQRACLKSETLFEIPPP
jgi:MinD-like ATPase involved in chromosome partitioning or flagellar assembly/tetratricopeptide (TPR) repeat protein